MAAIVIAGAGVTGLITAVRCVRAGHQVTLVDRGPIPNPASSSFDQHRALRALTPGDASATLAAATLHQRWLRLQELLGGRFYRRIGVVTGWPADSVDAVLDLARQAELSITLLAPTDLPHLVLPTGYLGVQETDAGVLLAERVLHAATRWLRGRAAVTLRPWRAVVAVDSDAGRLTLDDGTVLSGDVILLATGAWTSDLVDVRTVLHRQTTVYLQPPADLAPWWERAPIAGRVGACGHGWLMPPGAGTLLKLSSTELCRAVPAFTAADEDRAAARRHVARILTDPDRYTVAAVKQCHYTVAARPGDAVLARPGPAVWARAATGGDGFRTAPLIADHIVQLAAAGLAA
ncbi:FAD-binding oxidoreductase [Nocardia sp. NBC_00508]|uniref:NAD(P)/FAD-dependent oxidoreductase n=1 Tax=Nocardia sp. NBC_00508 TaxID=2975992 RepID=UPI002E8108A3|nr:FAD-binding oxidoreductase [Nocardia sp. NBC_00508]WUD66300.1 FAD-binding oxidoreductase [Nocardia sp. NBC_00508]